MKRARLKTTEAKKETFFCLPKQHADQIITHARSQAPLECCGVIAGINGKVTKIYTATNIEQSPVRYNIAPREILDIYKKIEEKGWQLLGIYHSHTHSEAYPSPTDIKLAFWTDSLYLIISLQNAEQPVIRAFHIRDGTMKEIPLKIV